MQVGVGGTVGCNSESAITYYQIDLSREDLSSLGGGGRQGGGDLPYYYSGAGTFVSIPTYSLLSDLESARVWLRISRK